MTYEWLSDTVDSHSILSIIAVVAVLANDRKSV